MLECQTCTPFHKISESMKSLIALIIIVFLTGCSLSKGKHLMVTDQAGKRADSSCGYFDNSIKFGDENEIIISANEVIISICSIDHRSKVVAKGFIIPLYAVSDGYEITKHYQWVKVTNSGSKAIGIINSSSLVKASFRKYPDNNAEKLLTLNKEKRTVLSGSHLWVGFPKEAVLTLDIETTDKTLSLNFTQAKSYSWYMATH